MAIKEVLGQLGAGAKRGARNAGSRIANNIAQNRQNNQENGIGKKIKDKAKQAAKALIKLIWKLLPFFVKIIIIVVIFVILMGIGIYQYIKQIFSSESQFVGTDAEYEQIKEVYESQGIDLDDFGLGRLDEDGVMLLKKYLDMEYIRVEGEKDNKSNNSKNVIIFDGHEGSVGRSQQTETIKNKDYKAKEDTKNIDINVRTIKVNEERTSYEAVKEMRGGQEEVTHYEKIRYSDENNEYNISLNNIINQYMVKSQLLTAVYLSSQNEDFTEAFIDDIIEDGTKVTLKEYKYLIYDRVSKEGNVTESIVTIYLIEEIETWFGTFKFNNNVSLDLDGIQYDNDRTLERRRYDSFTNRTI